jgi:hypothetical protein
LSKAIPHEMAKILDSLVIFRHRTIWHIGYATRTNGDAGKEPSSVPFLLGDVFDGVCH